MHDDQRTDGELTTRAAIVDDVVLMRTQFQAGFPALHLVGSYASAEDLVADRPAVDVVVLDLMLATGPRTRGRQGGEAIRWLLDQGYGRICVFTDERRPLVLLDCLSAGALGIARKSDPLEVTQDTFIRVARGQNAVASSLVGVAELMARRGSLPELTARQKEVLAARARGEPWKRIGRRLGIDTSTAVGHLEAAMDKMVGYLHDAGLGRNPSPADVERALGLSPGDLMDPATSPLPVRETSHPRDTPEKRTKG